MMNYIHWTPNIVIMDGGNYEGAVCLLYASTRVSR